VRGRENRAARGGLRAYMDALLAAAVTLVVPLAVRFVITGRFICLARPGRRKGTASTVTEAPVAEV
jgi:hypothetical protein